MYILRNAFLEKSQQIIIVLIRSQELDTAAADCGKNYPPSLELVMYTPLFVQPPRRIICTMKMSTNYPEFAVKYRSLWFSK